ncbi:MAG: ATP-binding protein [Lentimicrobium sp.]
MTSGLFERKDHQEGEVFSDINLDWVNHHLAPVILTDRAGSIIKVNRAFMAFTGFSREEITGSHISSLLNPDSRVESGVSSDNNRTKYLIPDKTNNGAGIICHCTREKIKPDNGEDLDLIYLFPQNGSEFALVSHHENGFIPVSKKCDDQNLSNIARHDKTIFNNIPDLLILSDNQANVIEVTQNPGFPIPHLGRFLKNKNLLNILPEDSRALFKKFREIAVSGEPASYYDDFIFGGEKRFLEFRLVSVDDDRILAIVRDVTRLKKTEKALIVSQERLNRMQRISGIGSWDVSFGEKTEILTWNFFELLGVSNPGSAISREHISHFHLVHPDDLSEYKNSFEEAIHNKSGEYRAEYRIIDSMGILRYLFTEAQLRFDNAGNLRHWSGTIQDITKRKKAESLKASAFQISQLIHSQHNLAHLMRAIHQIIASMMPAPNLLVAMISETDGKITFPYCIDPTGAPNSESAQNGLIGYVLRSGLPLLVSASAIDVMITENIIRSGEPVPESWLGVPLSTRDQVLGVLVLQSYSPDITYGEDEKNILIFVSEQIALSIQRINSDEALLNAKNQAEESSRLKSSLLANMSHELRTPMTGILGFSEILCDELEEDRFKVMASTIYKSANRLMSTLNSIMDLSAIEANIDSLKINNISIKSAFLPQLRNLHIIASDKGLYLRTALPPTIHVMADEKLLGQLLYHILDNAIKFTIDGGISISAYISDKDKMEAIIRVSDTGIGIAPEHHKLIFEEFRQVSEGMSRTFEGSGLGLALCSKIARLINARLWVDSVPGKGSDFYIALPTAFPDYTEPDTDQDSTPVINTQRLSRGPVPEILIVEDNEINRRLAALYLRELCNTEMAENGYVALEKIKRKKYDAILMDINLGAGPNGMSIANQVRTLENYKDVPIIAVTGYTMQGDREKLLSNGCSHYLAKPYDKKTLLRLFSDILYT